MRLRLKYSPSPEFAPNFARDIVKSTRELTGVELDYSVASLEAVDGILEDFHRDKIRPDEVGETLFGFGCYVGEVFVAQAGGRWRLAAETSMATIAGFPLVIELADERFCNPIGKVFKRLDLGKSEYLPYFYQVFTKSE